MSTGRHRAQVADKSLSAGRHTGGKASLWKELRPEPDLDERWSSTARGAFTILAGVGAVAAGTAGLMTDRVTVPESEIQAEAHLPMDESYMHVVEPQGDVDPNKGGLADVGLIGGLVVVGAGVRKVVVTQFIPARFQEF